MDYKHFYLALPFIVQAVDIINGTHDEMESFEKNYSEGWNYKTKREATSLINVVLSFEFSISLIRLYKLLNPLTGINNHSQRRGVDIIETYDNLSSVIKDIKSIRNNIHKELVRSLNMVNEKLQQLEHNHLCPA